MKPEHPNIVEFEVTGDYALFSDQIMRVGGEKCTYQAPAYEALNVILHSVYWKSVFNISEACKGGLWDNK